MIPQLLALALAISMQTSDRSSHPPSAIEAARTNHSITIDGRLDEPAWQKAPVIDQFRQRDPDEGAPPTQRTEVRILYDDGALYVGARMYDTSPDSIVARLGRRDMDIEADLFGIFIDSYFDRRSGFYFGVNAAGTIYDGVLYNDDWDSSTWDGVWQARTTIDELGWVAEMRIPLSQLRFRNNGDQVWGVNFRRDISRRNERVFLVYTPRNESGFVSRFVPLRGISDLQPPRRLEVLPYVTTKAAYMQFSEADPFNDGSRYSPSAGIDLRAGLGSNLTLNATVNPDFGQVEVDPAVVNLSDVETFFPERRPFFVEGASTFQFGQGGARNFWSFNFPNPSFFYSRRIGRAPQGSVPTADYSSKPEGTRILGAGKLTGKVLDSWNVGTIHAITAREWASVQYDGERFRAEVEPLTYYSVLRAQREIDAGRQGIGFIGTTTVRDLGNDGLAALLNRNAFTGGIDGWTFLDRDRGWVVTGWIGGTYLAGTPERLTDVQQRSTHYFQRPDAHHVQVDTLATSLSAYAGRVALNKQSGRYFLNSAFGVISPGFDTDDLGFSFRSDVINWHVGGGRQWSSPTRYFRYSEIAAAVFQNHDFGGNLTWSGGFVSAFMRLLNYYSLNAGAAYNPPTNNNWRTRGGPITLNPYGYQIDFGIRSDARKPAVVSAFYNSYMSDSGTNRQLRTTIQLRPASNVSLSLAPTVARELSNAQWVGVYDDPTATETFGRRYVFAEMDRSTLSADVRLDWTFTPQLSLQLFAQPLVSAGSFQNFKALSRSRSFDFLVFGENGSTFDPETFVADPDGPGPARPIELYNPDFNFVSLRGNAVLRWEYRPGSTLFLVWTQRRSDWLNHGRLDLAPSFDRLFTLRADNVFLVKLNYWLNI